MTAIDKNETTDRLEELEDIYQLSPMQQGMLFHTLYSPGSGVYVEQSLFSARGEFDATAFQRAWQKVIDRHSILRTSFVWEGLEQPQQVVLRRVRLPIELHDWSGFSADEQEQRIAAHIAADAKQGFELSKAPLMRLALFKLAPDRHRFCFTRHHLILDRWSRALLLKEVFALYEAFSNGKELTLEPAPAFRDYIAWLAKQDQGAAEQYWRSRLSGMSAPTGLGGDVKIEAHPEQGEYADERIFLTPDTTEKLREFARDNKLTLNVVAQGAWALLLNRYSGEDDVLFGATVSGRPTTLVNAESIVGLFVNTLPVRTTVSHDLSVPAWLRNIQDEQSRLQQFEYSSLIDIQGWSEIPRGVPLFESIFVFENLPVMSSHKPESKATEIVEDRGLGSTTGYPLTLLVSPGTRMAAQIIYDRTRFDSAKIRRMLGHYEQLLVNMTAGSHHSLARVQMLTAAEHRQIIHEWNDTELTIDSPSLVAQFEKQAERNPDAPAVIFGNNELSYAELNSRANRLARYLKRFGVSADQRVGICLERSIEMVVAVLATLKAGGAYVPLDPHYPAERLRFMLADSACAVVLTSNEVSLPQTNAPVLDVDTEDIALQDDSNLEEKIYDEQLAYIIYTSGSTGQPKGVAMPHGALRNLIGWQLQPPFAAARTAQFSSLSFDVSFQELFSAWCSGGVLVLLSEDLRRDAIEMLKLLRSQRVERLFLPFIYLQHLAEAATANGIFPETLRDVITAGEQLEITAPVRQMFERLPNCRLHNQYGPSESHVVTAYTLDGPVESWMALPPIGRPTGNTQIYIVDRNLNLLPVGVSGELLIAGANVSRGYLERPDATAEKFVPDPFGSKPGVRLYRTGDLARFREDGEIEFLGRIDNQVKIRGFRIELGEIETALIDNSSVREAAVIARDGIGAKELVAYLVVDGPARDGLEGELRSHLKTRLPDYMAPSHFVFLDALPLTSSGKVNRRALPAPELSLTANSASFQEPATPEQVQLAEIWEVVLQRKPIGVTDNFFELGGHSLLATQLVSRVRQAFNIDVPLRSLFESPTIAELAECLKKFEATETADTRIIAADKSDANDLLANLDEMSDSDVEALLNDLLAEQN